MRMGSVCLSGPCIFQRQGESQPFLYTTASQKALWWWLPSPAQHRACSCWLEWTWVPRAETSLNESQAAAVPRAAQIRQQTGDVRLGQAGLGSGSWTTRGFFTVSRRNMFNSGSLSLKRMYWSASPWGVSKKQAGRAVMSFYGTLEVTRTQSPKAFTQHYGCTVLCFSRCTNSILSCFSSSLKSMSEWKCQGNLKSLLSY